MIVEFMLDFVTAYNRNNRNDIPEFVALFALQNKNDLSFVQNFASKKYDPLNKNDKFKN